MIEKKINSIKSNKKVNVPLKPLGKPALAILVVASLKKNYNISLSQSYISLIVDEILNSISDAVSNGEGVRLIGHFSIRRNKTKARVSTNIKTKEKINVPAKYVPRMRFSSIMKKKVAQGSSN